MLKELLKILNSKKIEDENSEYYLVEKIIEIIIQENNLKNLFYQEIKESNILKTNFEKSFLKLYNEEYDQNLQSFEELLDTSNFKILNSNKRSNSKDVEKVLKMNFLRYEKEKKILDSPFSANKLRFDYYLPDFNLVIEYDGQQHFEHIEFFGDFNHFVKIRQLDIYKTKMCKELGINLLRIPYKFTKKELSEEIDLKIKTILKEKENLIETFDDDEEFYWYEMNHAEEDN